MLEGMEHRGEHTQKASLSMTMALDALKDSCDQVEIQKAKLAETMAFRNDLIKDAIDNGIKYRNLMRITKLSRERLSRIALGEPYSKDKG